MQSGQEMATGGRVSQAAGATPPTPYDGFDRMPIGGDWRSGRSGKKAADRDPSTGESVLESELGDARDVERGVSVAKRIRAGMTHVNDWPVDDEPNTAFGGEKASGLGRFGGAWALEEFTTDHWISVQEQPRRYPI